MRAALRPLLVLVLALCACDPDPEDPTSTRPPAAPDGTEAKAVVGPGGGVVAHPHGVTITYPPAAFDRPVEVRVKAVQPPDEIAFETNLALAAAYDVTITAVEQGPYPLLATPFEVTLPFDAEKAAAADRPRLRIAAAADPVYGLLDGIVDERTKTVRGTGIGRLSRLALVLPREAPPRVLGPDRLIARVGVPLVTAYTVSEDPTQQSFIGQLAGDLPAAMGWTGGLFSGTPQEEGRFVLGAFATRGSVQVLKPIVLDVAPATEPKPQVREVSPSGVAPGAPATGVAILGTGFTPRSRAYFANVPVPTMYRGPTRLAALVPASLLTQEQPLEVVVENPAGGRSEPGRFDVTTRPPSARPSLIRVEPDYGTIMDQDLHVSAFVDGAVPGIIVRIDGTTVPATMAGVGKVDVTIPAAMLKKPAVLEIRVANPPPGGGESERVATFTVYGGAESFVQGVEWVAGLVERDGYLYWATHKAPSIARRAIDGSGDTEPIVGGSMYPTGLAVDSEAVYVSGSAQGAGQQAFVKRIDLSSGIETALLTNGNQARSLLLRGNHLFFVQGDLGTGGAWRVPKAGGSAPVMVAGGWMRGFDVDDTHVYWTSKGGLAQEAVMRRAIEPVGGAHQAQELFRGGVLEYVKVYGDSAYFAGSGPPLYRVPKDGSSPPVVAVTDATSAELDATGMYYASYSHAARATVVMHRPWSGPARPLARLLVYATVAGLGAEHVYLLASVQGTSTYNLMRVKRN